METQVVARKTGDKSCRQNTAGPEVSPAVKTHGRKVMKDRGRISVLHVQGSVTEKGKRRENKQSFSVRREEQASSKTLCLGQAHGVGETAGRVSQGDSRSSEGKVGMAMGPGCGGHRTIREHLICLLEALWFLFFRDCVSIHWGGSQVQTGRPVM